MGKSAAVFCFYVHPCVCFWHVFGSSTNNCATQGEICDIDGTCVDAADDEIFKLTTKEGSLSMEREKVSY